jgi:hypothetical protein
MSPWSARSAPGSGCAAALYTKARILFALGRGDELGQVLEQIMAMDLYFNIGDRGKQRDFVDDASPGLIREDIVTRYNAFCPKQDRRDEIGDWIGELYQRRFSLDEITEHVRARLQDAVGEDSLSLPAGCRTS